jgi:hypothetical protein
LQRQRDPTGEVGERLLELLPVIGLNDAKHRFRPGQIKLAGQEGAQGKFPWLGSARPRVQQLRDQKVYQGRGRQRVQLDEFLARVATRSRPEVKVSGQRRMHSG